ncbi:MAG: hypothetical protein M3O15_07830, partial [Acidobacteriota bacterium]|nr:hypothetical protein [Acidobacteriota bacterium]
MTEVAAGQVEIAARAAGLTILSVETGEGSDGHPTTRYTLASAADAAKTQTLELSAGLAFGRAELQESLRTYLAEAAKRLRTPRPDCYLSLLGIPLSFGRFAWPFHHSTSGADTSIVHGEIRLEDGGESLLHAKISASMTVTFQEVVGLPEQPFAEGFIYNAVRKTLDQGQIELVKSGNRQPVPVTTRYYSARQGKFIFNDTTTDQRKQFLAAKTFWLSGVLGAGQPIWLLDPRDAQYLDTTVDDLRGAIEGLRTEGTIEQTDTEYAAATPRLLEQGE